MMRTCALLPCMLFPPSSPPRCSSICASEWRLATRLARRSSGGLDRVEQQTLLEPSDPTYVVRTIEVTLPIVGGSLGIELTELGGAGYSNDGSEASAALVVVTGLVEGRSAELHRGTADDAGSSVLSQVVKIGDTIVGVGGEEDLSDGCIVTEGASYEALIEVLGNAVAKANGRPLTLLLKRMVPLGRALVTARKPDGTEAQFVAYNGENLRMRLIREGLAPNDMSAQRYDNKAPGSGTCGGNGLCATCVISVLAGAENLSEKRAGERQLLRNVARWRQSCRTRIKLDDGEEATLTIALSPRSPRELLRATLS
jgi:ferredoxin